MIFIPDKIHVGFNKRKDVVNGLLGYVTYYDGKGVLRKKILLTAGEITIYLQRTTTIFQPQDLLLKRK